MLKIFKYKKSLVFALCVRNVIHSFKPQKQYKEWEGKKYGNTKDGKERNMEIQRMGRKEIWKYKGWELKREVPISYTA